MRHLLTCTERPSDSAIEQAPGVWEIASAAAVLETTEGDIPVDTIPVKPGLTAAPLEGTARRDAVPPRWDLPTSHPLRGYRALSGCYSGDCDRVLGEDGTIHPVPDTATLDGLVKDGKVKRAAAPKPADPKPLEEPTEADGRTR